MCSSRSGGDQTKLVELPTATGDLPLLKACRIFSNTDEDHGLLLTLIQASASVNAVNGSSGRTPLISACLRGSMRVVKSLLHHGADPCASISMELLPNRTDFRTALEAACHYARVECIDILADFVRESEGHWNVRAFINQQSGRGRTALMRACSSCSTECASRLLDLKAQPDLVDKEGQTALIYACNLQNASATNNRLVSLLLAAEADPDLAHTGTGVTPLMFAAGNGHVLVVAELIQAGVCINATLNGDLPCCARRARQMTGACASFYSPGRATTWPTAHATLLSTSPHSMAAKRCSMCSWPSLTTSWSTRAIRRGRRRSC